MKRMKQLTFTLACFLLMASPVHAQQDKLNPELVVWMRTVNILESEYKMARGHYGDEAELTDYAKTAKEVGSAVAFTQQFSQTSMQPYALHVVIGRDGSHYLATIKTPSDMHDESTWCKTEVFSGDDGLISLGQNIQCSGVALGASSRSKQKLVLKQVVIDGDRTTITLTPQ